MNGSCLPVFQVLIRDAEMFRHTKETKRNTDQLDCWISVHHVLILIRPEEDVPQKTTDSRTAFLDNPDINCT